MPQPTIFKLPWPRGGFVEDSPRAEQPEGTTMDCLNVRNYDSLERRNRGGKRSGLVKVSNTEVNGTNAIQNLTPIVEALDLVQSASWGDKLTDPVGSLSGNFGRVRWAPDGSYVVQSTQSAGVRVWSFNGVTFGSGTTLAHSTITSALGTGQVNGIALSPNGEYLFLATDGGLGVCTISTGSGFGAITEYSTLTQVKDVFITDDSNAVLYVDDTGTRVHAVAWTGSAFGSAFSDPGTSLGGGGGGNAATLAYNAALDIVVAGNSNAGSSELRAWPFDTVTGFGTEIDTQAVASSIARLSIHPTGSHVAISGSSDYRVYPFSTGAGFGTLDNGAAGVGTLNAVGFSKSGSYLAVAGSSSPRAKIYAFSNGVGTAITDPGTVPTSTVYDVDWSASDAAIGVSVGSGAVNVQTWTFLADSINPTARETRLVAVSGGSVSRSTTDFTVFTQVASGGSAFDSSAPYIDSAIAFQKLFFCDGLSANYQFLDFADNTLKDWATSVTGGTLPQGSTDTTLGCRIIANYRGRIVLSGLKEDPQNWFMSAKDDPFDWDYSPTTTSATQAVAGNNADAGLMGDIITGLFPYKDDLLVMGGANEINIMSGDPADGGAIDNLTRNVGISGPHAGCFDTVGNFYFFGVNGLYRVAAGLGSQPQLVSQGRLDRTLSDIDVSANDIRLQYDPLWQGVHIFVVPSSQPTVAPLHYFYDERNDSFWPDQYPATVGPTAAVYLATDNPENSGLIIGGWDGFVRRFNPGTLTDDGTAISSYCRFTPLAVGDIFASSRVDDVTFLLDKASGNTTFKLFAGDTVEDAEDQADANTPRFSRTVVGGRNQPFRPRVAQNAFIFELSHAATDSTWAYEGGGGRVAVLARMKGRRV